MALFTSLFITSLFFLSSARALEIVLPGDCEAKLHLKNLPSDNELSTLMAFLTSEKLQGSFTQLNIEVLDQYSTLLSQKVIPYANSLFLLENIVRSALAKTHDNSAHVTLNKLHTLIIAAREASIAYNIEYLNQTDDSKGQLRQYLLDPRSSSSTVKMIVERFPTVDSAGEKARLALKALYDIVKYHSKNSKDLSTKSILEETRRSLISTPAMRAVILGRI